MSRRQLPIVSNPAETTRTPIGCTDCGLCCTYVAIEIDEPSSATRASLILWYLYHQSVSIYWDTERDWMVQFESRCEHLQPDRKCGIYESRPQICRDFDEVDCEVNSDDQGTTYYSAEEFLEYLKVKRKRVYESLQGRYMPPLSALAVGRGRRARSAHGPVLAKVRASALTTAPVAKPVAVKARPSSERKGSGTKPAR